MPKLFSDDAMFDQSARAEDVLDVLLDDTSSEAERKRTKQAAVEEELRKERILKAESQRVRSRVLFITKDVHVLEENSASWDYFKNLEDVFDEIHIIVMGIRRKEIPPKRISKKVWAYPITTKSFLWQPFAARALAGRQLQFSEGFRPDIIVAQDAFESGVAGYLISKRFKRAFQVHILEDFYTSSFVEEDEHNKWRLQFANYVLKRVDSIRVSTDRLKRKIKEKYPKIIDVALIPKYFNIQETIKRASIPLEKKLYPQFVFSVLFIGTLDSQSTLFRAIDAVRSILRTPRIGMIVIGDGPNKEEYKERAKILGIDSKILFQSKTKDILPHMQSTDILIQTDTSSESEEVVITAAAAGLPLLIAKTELRDDLFTDSVDAFLCEEEDTLEFTQKLTKFLNTPALRVQFAKNARDVVRTRIEEDPQLYKLALRDSIEEVLYVVEDKKNRTLEKIKKEISKEKAQKEEKERKQKEVYKQKLQKKISPQGIEMKIPE